MWPLVFLREIYASYATGREARPRGAEPERTGFNIRERKGSISRGRSQELVGKKDHLVGRNDPAKG